MSLQLVNLVLLLSSSQAYPNYKEQIPNGDQVEHPCKVNYRWPGVGHENPLGGGPRNVFGVHFQKAGNKWTKELCSQDSDEDGQTNGQELGDPDCVWLAGQIPSRTKDITHPGVCDPFNSTACQDKNKLVSCQLQKFDNCDAIKRPEVMTVDLRFPKIQIPASVTNYFCMTFDLPSDASYHIIANEPLIENRNVAHHMLLYGCSEESDLLLDSPSPCWMSQGGCVNIIGTWTVGMAGHCYGDNVGYRIGQSGYKKVKLEIHYNNPQKVPDYTDTSGLRLYYQPAKTSTRDLTTIMTGQTLIKIPPGQKRVEVVGTCPSSCTQMLFTKPAYIISAGNHMHYRGRSMKIEVFRNNSKILDLTNDEVYNYDSPVIHEYSPAVQILPGDEIKTTCIFSSLTDTSYTFFGDGTDDEMCYGFISAYPAEAFSEDECISVGPYTKCDFLTGAEVEGCDWKTYANLSHPNTVEIIEQLNKKCNLDGLCRPECQDYLESLRDHPCLFGEASFLVKASYSRSYEGVALLGRLHSCPVTADQCRGVCEKSGLCENKMNWAERGYLSPVTMLFNLLLTSLVLSRFCTSSS